MSVPTCPSDSRKLNVNLKGENQDVSFEPPIDSVEFPDGACTRRHVPSRSFLIGSVSGAGLCATLIYAWMSFTETVLCSHHYKPISMEAAMRLEDPGITWNTDNRVWDVTTVSPIVQKVGR